jgi:integrating conjugative element protein (TIGR03759 family)
MEGIRGSVSAAIISPIEVLGIHARDDAERRDYAERWAVLMREDVDRILAFQRAYDEAGRFLFPGERLIDLIRLSSTAFICFPPARPT